ERLSLAADQPAGILGLNIQEDSVFHAMFFDRGAETEQGQYLFQRGFGFGGHVQASFEGLTIYFLFFRIGVNTGPLAGIGAVGGGVGVFRMSLVCRMVSKFWTVQ